MHRRPVAPVIAPDDGLVYRLGSVRLLQEEDGGRCTAELGHVIVERASVLDAEGCAMELDGRREFWNIDVDDQFHGNLAYCVSSQIRSIAKYVSSSVNPWRRCRSRIVFIGISSASSLRRMLDRK